MTLLDANITQLHCNWLRSILLVEALRVTNNPLRREAALSAVQNSFRYEPRYMVQ